MAISRTTIDRRLVTERVERRAAAADGGPTTLIGYAAVFGVETVIGDWFREVILPGAFADSIANDDVPAQFNHDPNYVLGRTANGTVRLSEDRKGLKYEVDLNADDPDAQRVGAKVARGDVRGSSFAFSVEDDDGEEWVRDDPAKLPLRKIKRAKLYDVAPVTSPAYETTSVSARSLERSAAQAPTAVVPAAVAETPVPPATVPIDLLERELALLDLDA